MKYQYEENQGKRDNSENNFLNNNVDKVISVVLKGVAYLVKISLHLKMEMIQGNFGS